MVLTRFGSNCHSRIELLLHNSNSIDCIPGAPHSITIQYYFSHDNYKKLANDEESLGQTHSNTKL